MTTWKNIPKMEEPWLKFYPKESPRHIEYEEIPIDSILKRALKEFSNCTAIAFEGKYLTYAELDNAVDKFATGLSKLGVKEKDVVAIDTPNIPQYVIAFFAIARLGAVVNPIVALNRYAEIVHQCNDSKASILIMHDFLFEEHLHGKPLNKMTTVKTIILTGIGEYLPGIKRVLGTALNKIPRMKVWPTEVDGIKFLKFQDILNSGAGISIPPVKINPKQDTVTLIYTGGTTGAPKGVEQTHFNLIANCFQAHTWVNTQIPKFNELRGIGGMVCILPLSHSFGLTLGMLIGLWFGLKLILVPAPPPKISNLLKEIVHENAIFCPGVPTLWNKINQDPDSVKYKEALKSGNFLACMSGAAPLPAEVKAKFEELTGSIIIEGYGMSECSPVLTGNPFNRSRPGVGLPMADTYIKIADAVEGNSTLPLCPHSNDYCLNQCSPEEAAKYIGEICGCGPQVMKGYLNRPEESTKVLRKDKDGAVWYYTSDIGCLDAEGYLHIKDRKRDMIKRSGHAVFPREVEDLMYTYDAILEVAVYGIPSAETGEEIKAVVSLKPDFIGKVTEKDIIEWCKANIAPYKYPRVVQIVKEIPKSPVGKVLRRVLRDEDLAKK